MTDSEKLDLLLVKVSGLESDVSNLKLDVSNLKSDVKAIDSRLDKVDSRLDRMDSRLDQMDSRFDRMDSRLDVIELKQNRTAKKLGDLQLDVKIAERNISRDIHILKDQMETVIEVLRQNELLPR